MFKRLDFWLGCGYAWDVGGYAFFFSSMCIAFAFTESSNGSGGSQQQLLVEPRSFGHGGHGFDSEMERLGEERRERERERLKA